MGLGLIHAREGLHIFGRALRCRFRGPERFEGNARQVCRAVIERCWNDEQHHFMTSAGNYPVFYARDFGMCVDSLLALGMHDRVRTTLQYALNRYAAHGRFRLAINHKGVPFDFPDVYAPDGLAFLLHSLAALGDESLVHQYAAFLNQELRRFKELVIDPTTGLVRDGYFSSMRDYAIRNSSCYDNVMAFAIQQRATQLGLENPLPWNYPDLIKRHFWNGTNFVDDRSPDAVMTGDANVIPFWFNVFPEPEAATLWASVQQRLIEGGFEDPFPLRYEQGRNSMRKMFWLDTLTDSWELDTVWMHLGNLFLQVLARYDEALARHYLERHQALIEREHCYPEVLTKTGALHKSLFFSSDTSMLWAANWLALSIALQGE
ncbi:hypothetical protein D6789_01445 [Candidatus Woesearchaeota archaeon]|nr:MAG: hypothetical protein D6789_01445 [Candidatus Woesearchaeota archaeon]